MCFHLFFVGFFFYISIQKYKNEMPIILDKYDPCMWSRDKEITTRILHCSI